MSNTTILLDLFDDTLRAFNKVSRAKTGFEYQVRVRTTKTKIPIKDGEKVIKEQSINVGVLELWAVDYNTPIPTEDKEAPTYKAILLKQQAKRLTFKQSIGKAWQHDLFRDFLYDALGIYALTLHKDYDHKEAKVKAQMENQPVNETPKVEKEVEVIEGDGNLKIVK